MAGDKYAIAGSGISVIRIEDSVWRSGLPGNGQPKLVLEPTKHDSILVKWNRCLVEQNPIVKLIGK
uniref:Uncharacterized protein n=1 Tax=Candidatus Kentrum sp. LFY TaxID=2126342 RepID=A0A450WPB7_9GAMM|nr:MAG: hypothetical protein BECKLFY1418C_GA0070996_104916 [Candidatus Kentron sp. LFY]